MTQIKKYFKSDSKQTVDNYPYGWKQATAHFSLEFNGSKGFRSVFQTVNPKTNRLNKPKKSTYSPIIMMYLNNEDHVKYLHFDLNGAEAINKGCKFIYDAFDTFTPAQIEHIYMYLTMMLKIGAKATITYKGAKWEDIEPFYTPALKLAVNGIKTGKNLFNEIVIDNKSIDAVCPKDYQPFKISKAVNIMDL